MITANIVDVEHVEVIASLVKALLIELEPEAKDELEAMDMVQIATDLFQKGKLFTVLAKDGDIPVGVLTLHECAAIYAGGIFGEISELYVVPEYRSKKVGQIMLETAVSHGKTLGWKRLEVGSPPPNQWPRTVAFYEKNDFVATGTRLRRLIT